MARTIKPTHVKAVAALLEEGAETAEELAKACIRKVDELREDDKTFMVVGQWDSQSGSYYMGFGPYSTKKQAVKANEKRKAGPIIAEHVAVLPTCTPEHLEPKWPVTAGPPPPLKWAREVREDSQNGNDKPVQRQR